MCSTTLTVTSVQSSNSSPKPVTTGHQSTLNSYSPAPAPSLKSTSQSQPVIVHKPSPSIQSTWHHQFEIPDLHNFSGIVKTAVETGIVTGLARREIIQVLRTYMLRYTIRPTSEQYQTVCIKLITKYPNLKDTEGDSTYVSK